MKNIVQVAVLALAIWALAMLMPDAQTRAHVAAAVALYTAIFAVPVIFLVLFT